MADEDPIGGRYWTLAGINTLLGPTNVAIESNLGNETRELVIDQVIADGATADAYTDFRASRGSIIAPTPIISTSPNFAIVQLATNLYASWLLIAHRIDDDVAPAQMTDEGKRFLITKAKGLESRALELYHQLFGDVLDPTAGAFVSVPIDRSTATPCSAYPFGYQR